MNKHILILTIFFLCTGCNVTDSNPEHALDLNEKTVKSVEVDQNTSEDLNHYSGTYQGSQRIGYDSHSVHIRFDVSWSQKKDDCTSIQNFQFSNLTLYSNTTSVGWYTASYSYYHNDFGIFAWAGGYGDFPIGIDIMEIALQIRAPGICL